MKAGNEFIDAELYTAENNVVLPQRDCEDTGNQGLRQTGLGTVHKVLF